MTEPQAFLVITLPQQAHAGELRSVAGDGVWLASAPEPAASWTFGPCPLGEALRVAVTLQVEGLPGTHPLPGTRPYAARAAIAATLAAASALLHAPQGPGRGQVFVAADSAKAARELPMAAFYEWTREGDAWDCGYTADLARLDRAFDEAFSREIFGWVFHRRRQRGRPLASPTHPSVSNDLYGIALSGGGMRSAVFSLGVCQSLAKFGLLAPADYLSTASGGGYFGASLQALCAEDLPYHGLPGLDCTAERFPFASPRPPETGAVEGDVHAVETPATWHVRKYARLLGNAVGVFDPATWGTIGRYMASLLLLWLVFLLPAPGVLAGIGILAWPSLWEVAGDWPGWARWTFVLAPPLAAIAGPWLAVMAYRAGAAAAGRGKETMVAGRAARTFVLACGLFAVAWLALAALVASVWLLRGVTHEGAVRDSARGVIAAVGLSGAAMEAAGLRQLWSAGSSGEKSILTKLLVAVGGYLLLAAIIVCGTWGLFDLEQASRPAFLVLFAGAGVTLIATLGAPARAGAAILNLLSLHDLYRARIEQTWIVAARPAGSAATRVAGRWTRVWRRPELRVTDLGRIGLLGFPERMPVAPYPLICTTLNIPGSRGEKLPERKSDSFVIGPLVTGSALTRWRPTRDLEGFGEMRLSGAAAASGAAVSPNMGEKTSQTVSIAATIFNARLGLWVRNPRRGKGRSALLLYFKELFGQASRDDQFVYLSDGGHFENLGLYELLRRRCRYVLAVASDVEPGEGPDRMGNLGTALRMARVDFGVSIEMPDLRPLLRDEATGAVRSWFAAGRIRYPGEPNTEGIFVFIKTGVVPRHLPPDLLNHWRSQPAFPYDSTSDQQYDQPQFESYRVLGQLAGETVGSVSLPGEADIGARFRQIEWAYRRSLGAEPG